MSDSEDGYQYNAEAGDLDLSVEKDMLDKIFMEEEVSRRSEIENENLEVEDDDMDMTMEMDDLSPKNLSEPEYLKGSLASGSELSVTSVHSQASLVSYKKEFAELDNRPPMINGSDEVYTGSIYCVSETSMRYHGAHGGNEEHSIKCFPWPKPDQRVPWPESWRKTDENGLEDPFEYHPCGWWWSYVFCGGDHKHFRQNLDNDKAVAEIYQWELPAIGTIQSWTPQSVDESSLPEELRSKFNMQTIFSKLQIHRVLKIFRNFPMIYMFVLSFFSILVPSLIACLVYGAVPIGNPFNCNFGSYATWLFFVNPFSETTIAFSILTLMFGCVDYKLPWRPMTMYLPILGMVYLSQILVVLPVVLTVGPFAVFGIVIRTITYLVTVLGMILFRPAILKYDISLRNNEHFSRLSALSLLSSKADEKMVTKEVDPEMNARYTNYIKYVILQYFTVIVYIGYAYGQKVFPAGGQTALSVGSFIFQVIIRKIAQTFTNCFHKDYNYICSGFWVYTINALFIVFSTPNFEIETEDVTIDDGFFSRLPNLVYVLGFGVVTDVAISLLHQSHIWFRFRCWVKVLAIPTLTNSRMWIQGLPIYIDMNFDGRGNTNAHPEYRRSKVSFDFYQFLATLVAHMSFILVSLALRFGLNRDRFPFSDIPELSFFESENRGFTNRDHSVSLIYATTVAVIAFLGIVAWTLWLRKYHPQNYITLKDQCNVFHREPFKIGFLLAILTANLFQVINFFLLNNRVWYADVGGNYICQDNNII